MILSASVFTVSLVSIALALYAQERKGTSSQAFITIMALVGLGALITIFAA